MNHAEINLPVGSTVLVIDEDEQVVSFITHVLEGMGLEARPKNDGYQACEVGVYGLEDVVAAILGFALDDKEMDLTGLDVYQHLRYLREDLPIIFAYTPDVLHAHFPDLVLSVPVGERMVLRVGNDLRAVLTQDSHASFVAKPLKPQEIEQALSMQLRG